MWWPVYVKAYLYLLACLCLFYRVCICSRVCARLFPRLYLLMLLRILLMTLRYHSMLSGCMDCQFSQDVAEVSALGSGGACVMALVQTLASRVDAGIPVMLGCMPWRTHHMFYTRFYTN